MFTLSAHSRAELRPGAAQQAGVDAAFHLTRFCNAAVQVAGSALGLFRAQALAGSTAPAFQPMRWAGSGQIPPLASKRLTGSAFSGLAAIEGLEKLEPPCRSRTSLQARVLRAILGAEDQDCPGRQKRIGTAEKRKRLAQININTGSDGIRSSVKSWIVAARR